MRKYIALLFLPVLFASCADDDIVTGGLDNPGGLSTEESEVRLPIRASYHSIHVESETGSPSGLPVHVDEDWIELMSDTVSYDGYVEIYVDRNEGLAGRSGYINIGNAGDEAIDIKVYQCGLGDDDDNGSITCYAGCGYNIFQELNAESSICNPIFDYDRATAVDPMIVQTVARTWQDTKSITSNSMVEMSELMTTMQEKTRTGLKGGKKTILRFEEQKNTTSFDQTGYAYINFQRIVACSSLDLSKAIQYMEQKQTDILTDDFRKRYDDIVDSPSEEKIFRLFKDYGTHIISYVDLGGTMDIAVNFNRTMVGELNMRAEDFNKYFFNGEPSDYTLANGDIQGMDTKVNNTGTFKIFGGDRQARQQIIKDCNGSGRIKPEHIEAWTRSLPKNNFMSEESLSRLSPINVQLVPIWSLFPQQLANLFFQCAIAESQKSMNDVTASAAGLDNYGIKISGADYMRFGGSPDESLVRVVYADHSNLSNADPILEVCHEYIPVLKSNERVPVIYPIRKGRTFHGTGLYPGDGKGCPPAWLTFSEGDVFVLPVDGVTPSTRIDSVYYLHGNIYLTSLGLDLKRNFKMQWKPKGILDLPIVKIGSGYWTRRNIDKTINSGFFTGSVFNDREYDADNGEIWVNVNSVLDEPPTGIGPDMDDIYQKPMKWYYPTDIDRDFLTRYVGYETRHLLKGNLSGFDAQFEGFYGPGDIDGVPKSNKMSIHNTDKCYLIFKTSNDYKTGTALCLDKNYRWKVVALGNGKNNFFPLRLFRTCYYKYDKYSNAKDHYTK